MSDEKQGTLTLIGSGFLGAFIQWVVERQFKRSRAPQSPVLGEGRDAAVLAALDALRRELHSMKSDLKSDISSVESEVTKAVASSEQADKRIGHLVGTVSGLAKRLGDIETQLKQG